MPGIVYKVYKADSEFEDFMRVGRLEMELEEIQMAMRLSKKMLAPHFYGVVASTDGRLGFAMERVNLFQFDELPEDVLRTYNDRIRQYRDYLWQEGFTCGGDIELVGRLNDTGSIPEPDNVEILLVDLSSVSRTSGLNDVELARKTHLDTFNSRYIK